LAERNVDPPHDEVTEDDLEPLADEADVTEMLETRDSCCGLCYGGFIEGCLLCPNPSKSCSLKFKKTLLNACYFSLNLLICTLKEIKNARMRPGRALSMKSLQMVRAVAIALGWRIFPIIQVSMC